MDPRIAECIGYLGAALVFGAFWTRDMLPLRVVAIASNLAFMVYGAVTGALPVLLLHAALLPLNGWRLVQGLGDAETTPAAGLRRGCARALHDRPARLTPRAAARRRTACPSGIADAAASGSRHARRRRAR